jgi:SNF2 family DNA or RNA helicase
MTEIRYHILAELSEQQRCLVIQLLDETGKSLPSSAFSSLKQREALSFLSKLGKPLSPHVYRIPYSQTLSALKWMAATGQLYFNQKEVIPDFYSDVEFYFYVTLRDNQPLMTGRLKTRDREIDLSTCDFLCCGPPHWFIKDTFLRVISTDISWSQIKEVVKGSYKLSLLEEDVDNPKAPKILYDANVNSLLTRSPDPLPFLMLKDRTGAFADLGMHYGEDRVNFHDVTKHIPRKQEAEKAWEKDLLETGYLYKPVGTSHYYCPMDKVAKSLTFLLELGWKIVDWQGRHVVRQHSHTLELAKSHHFLEIRGKIRFEEYEAQVSDVMGAFNRRERFIQLDAKHIGLLPDRWEHTEIQNLQEETEIVGDCIRMPLSRIGLWAQAPLSSQDSWVEQVRHQLTDSQGIQRTLPSSLFQGQLRPYQQEGIDWLAFLYRYGFHGILADDMGLGKTVQVLAFLSQLTLTAPILIVLPTSLLFNWRQEIERFLPSLPFHIHHGPLRAQSTEKWPSTGILLTTYTTLRLDLSLFSSIHFQAIILDEAQAIKNAYTQIAQALFQLKSSFKLSVTGTPVENHPLELWSHFRFLMPDLLGEAETFQSEMQAAHSDSRYLKRVKQKIRPFVLRRQKEEVAKDLPSLMEQTVWIEMESEQRQLYEQFLAGFKGNLLKKVELEGLSKHRLEVLEAILRLRQICCHPLLVSSLLEDSCETASAKMEALLQDLESVRVEGRKALIYSQFTQMLSLIAREVSKRSWSTVYLDGSTRDREQAVTQFQNDPSISFFLISLKAGGTGLNLTAADYVFIYDPWWNEAVEAQAISRAHRIGRESPVMAKRYALRETIEEKMMKLKTHKKAVVNDLVNDEEMSTLLTEEDLTELFRD